MTGKWILFADSDDFFVENFMNVVSPFLNSDYDMVYFPPTSMDLKTGKISSRHVMYMEMILKAYEKPTLKNITEMKFAFCSPWSKLIRTAMMKDNDITFDEVAVSNDIMCLTKCAYHCRKVGISNQTIYCVTRGGNSLTTNKDEKRFDTRVDVFVNRYIYAREHLSKKEFRYTHLDRQALGKLVDVFIEKWGAKKFFWICGLYMKNRIYIFDWGLLNPVTLFHKAKVELQWWMDIKKHRK
ncbi:MAG: glycosyltransferase family 2 protein [Lachnospiraceae bacterium]|nr:glycosyltransferase family 2 protein [Lachnospiraceae bacterium]